MTFPECVDQLLAEIADLKQQLAEANAIADHWNEVARRINEQLAAAKRSQLALIDERADLENQLAAAKEKIDELECTIDDNVAALVQYATMLAAAKERERVLLDSMRHVAFLCGDEDVEYPGAVVLSIRLHLSEALQQLETGGGE